MKGQRKLSYARIEARLRDLRTQKPQDDESDFRPRIVLIGPGDDVGVLDQMLSEVDIVEVVDQYEEMLEELLFCRRPPLKHEVQMQVPDAVAQRNEFVESHLRHRHPWAVGSWVYLPWRRTLLRLLPNDLHQELRTARNRGWIEPDEQATFSRLAIGIVGLSVGSGIAISLAQEGGARRMKLADFDRLAGTNLNRIRGTFADLGIPKTGLVARQIFELDPYAELSLFPTGVSDDNVALFFDDPPRLSAVVDACDDPLIKIRLRMEARTRSVPLVMATDMGDDVILDVERYDLDPNYPLLHGRLGADPEDWLQHDLSPQDRLRLIMAFLGVDTMPPRMMNVGARLGRDLDGPPQLAGTCAMAAGAVSHILRRILVGGDPLSGRFRLAFSSVDSK